jgi:peptidoglycan hydrolase CwlO-like protein
MKTLRLKQKIAAATSILVLLVSGYSGVARAVSSAELRAQANALQAQINEGNARARELAAQADSLKKAIGALDVQIGQADAQIAQTSLKIQELQNKLDETQAELDRQKDLLKDSMRALYKKGGASTVELLIGSDSFSQFIDSQEYLTRLKAAIQDSTNKVIDLKQEIQKQQFEQQDLLKVQQAQKDAVAATRAERQGLLEQTQGDEARYRSLVSSLRAQQADVNARLFAQIQLESGNGNNGGYPYNNYAFSMIPWGCGPGEGPDRWGYCTRQCVSYAAWAVERSGRQAPMYYGNAKNWVNAAPSAWQYNTPQAGDVGVATGGGFGHVAYVEAVYGNGTMRISQYNAQVTGEYSEATVSIYFFNKYIRFP